MQNNIFSGTPNGVQPIKKTMSQGMSSSKIRKQGREKKRTTHQGMMQLLMSRSPNMTDWWFQPG